MTAVTLDWIGREPPLAPCAALATGYAVPALAHATARQLAAGRDVRVLRSDDVLLVLGSAPDLPWAPGVRYLGWEDGLLLPTTKRPTLPADLLRAAAYPDAPESAVVAVTPDLLLVGARPLRPPDPAELT